MIMSEWRYSKADTNSHVKKRAVSVLNLPCLEQFVMNQYYYYLSQLPCYEQLNVITTLTL